MAVAWRGGGGKRRTCVLGVDNQGVGATVKRSSSPASVTLFLPHSGTLRLVVPRRGGSNTPDPCQMTPPRRSDGVLPEAKARLAAVRGVAFRI